MGFAELLLIVIFIGWLLLIPLFILLSKKLIKGSQKILEKRSQDFKRFADKHWFDYNPTIESSFFDSLKNFHLFNLKEIQPILNFLSKGKPLRDVDLSAKNHVSGSDNGVKWNLFDFKYRIFTGGSGVRSRWHCTVFHGTFTGKNFPKLIILRKTIFDFWEKFTPNAINFPSIKIEDSGLSKKYRIYGESINTQSLTTFLEELSQIKQDINMETAGNEFIFFTRITNYPIFDTSKLEQVFSKIKKSVLKIPQN